MARLSSYLCLKEQGSLSTIHELRHFAPQEPLANVFVTSLTKSISERLREEYRKREEEEKKRWDAAPPYGSDETRRARWRTLVRRKRIVDNPGKSATRCSVAGLRKKSGRRAFMGKS